MTATCNGVRADQVRAMRATVRAIRERGSVDYLAAFQALYRAFCPGGVADMDAQMLVWRLFDAVQRCAARGNARG
jgi:hypothetical protein